MTIKELSEELEVTIETLFSFFENIEEQVSQELGFQLTDELCDKARANKLAFEDKTQQIEVQGETSQPQLRGLKILDRLEELKRKSLEREALLPDAAREQIEEKRRKREEQAKELNSYFNRPEKQLLSEVKKHNNIDSLVFNGEFNKDFQGRNFGFFTKILHESGERMSYPILNEKIEDIFIATNELTGGKRYSFLVQIARKPERDKKSNPFLLQARIERVEEIIQLTETQQEIVTKKKKLKEIEQEISGIDQELVSSRLEIEKQVETLKNEKEREANNIIEGYNETITQKFNEITEKENLIADIGNQIFDIQIQLSEFSNKKSEMEATINFLRQKIDTCKNLEFMSEQDVNRYLKILTTLPFEVGKNYLDFEKDLSANFPKLVTHIQNYLYHKKNLIYTEFQIKNFMSLLMTNDLIVLSGLSGSGKTQIVKSFAEVLGGVAKIIPVKPNWTSSDDLLGYYNPIQSSFLPTPFTEAIAEAIQNPHQIYFICLDEMNLARAEYYFADFLSKMEERSEQPEIDLYAKHEEELFISEFKTLLTLIESATGEKMVSSWQEFLETDSIRNRFFELLGNTEKETLLQIHSKMKRRLLDILKFPATIKIPNNVRFIGAINVDETTHYFSPKILDRVHIVKFENPLLIEDEVATYMENSNYETELKPVYLNPIYLGLREELPPLSSNEFITKNLKELNKDFLLPLSIDFGVRSMRQSINYAKQFAKVSDMDTEGDYLLNEASALNAIINQKILPRFIFDGSEKLKNGEVKTDLLDKLATYIQEKISPIFDHELGNYEVGYYSDDYLRSMVTNAKLNNGQVNFYA